MTAVAVVFWVCAGLLVYAQVGYGVVLAGSRAVRSRRRPAGRLREAAPDRDAAPSATVVVAAYAEAAVIGDKVANLRALDDPSGRLQVIVACDGSPDQTAARARAAGADLVLELPRGGKIRAQDAAVRAARGELVVFSDANAFWEPDALRRLLAPFADPAVGYVCGDVRFEAPDGTNQEGLYWRYEMWLRRAESELASVTAGNGAIYAVRRDAYVEIDPAMSHDLTFPYLMVKRGYRALYAPDARAHEKMAPSIEGEFARKRRMAGRAWPTVLRGGMLSPRGYGPLYALMIVSHRLLRYASPFLHLLALAANIALVGQGWVYVVTLVAQLALLAASALGRWVHSRPLLIARYYVLTTASLAAGLWDVLRGAGTVAWEPVEGTR